MSKHTDIAKQIEKYLNGELDARAMHQLEREAQNDPFLLDTLEGYSKAGANQQTNLNDIAGRLQQRTAKGKVRSMLIWRLSAAASVIVVLGAIGLWMYNDKPKINESALTKQVEIIKSPEMVISAAPVKADSALQTVAEKPSSSQSPYIASIKTKPHLARRKNQPTELVLDAPPAANEIVADKQSDILQEKVAVGFFNTRKEQAYTPASDSLKNASNLLAGRVAGLNVVNAPSDIKSKIVIGKVTTNDNLPLPGVTITVDGTNKTTTTDSRGNFKIPVVPDKSELNIAFIGFNTTRVKVKNQDSLMIAMQPSQSSLNEVAVVSDHGSKRKIKKAHPINGWDEFNEYLKENAVSPDGKKGTVKLSFTVNSDGSLTDFAIIKGLSDQTDQEAIALVKDGPSWLADISGAPQKVELRIRFRTE